MLEERERKESFLGSSWLLGVLSTESCLEVSLERRVLWGGVWWEGWDTREGTEGRGEGTDLFWKRWLAGPWEKASSSGV